MKLGTRLLLTLLSSVAVIMAVYGYWALEQREAVLLRQARAETRAYGAALGLALEHALRDLQFRDVQAILDEIGTRPTIHGILLYDTAGVAILRSARTAAADVVDPPRVREVIQSDTTRDLVRSLAGTEVLSILRPIRDREGRVTGVLEVLQPLSFVAADKARTRERFLLNTLTLLVVLAGLTTWLLRRFVDRPIARFIAAIRSVGRGDLSQRVAEEPTGSELAAVAREFNRMAEGLESAREALVRETGERLALEQRVREQEKLASLGTLAAGVAHQIAAPLNVIEGRARLLLTRDGSDPERARNLEAIVEQSRRITRIVRSLLDFARRPEPVVRTVDLGRSLEEAVTHLRQDLEEADAHLRREGPNPPDVRGDPDLIQEVLMILLTNALEAVREVEGAREIVVRTGTSDGEAWVEVADSGPGIPEEVLPRVFEAFFSTKPGGTGLGLAVARSVVEGLGGRLEARNAQGATFRFTLPLAEAEDRRRA